MGRKCSHCGNKGHNSRTCTTNKGSLVGGLRLFGVHLTDKPSPSSPSFSIAMNMKKSFSMDCLSVSSTPSSSSSSQPSIDENSDHKKIPDAGYLSDCLTRRNQERKKGEFVAASSNSYFFLFLDFLLTLNNIVSLLFS